MDNVQTIRETLLGSVAEFGDRVALRYKRDGDWRLTTYTELLEQTRKVSQCLARHRVKAGDRVGIHLANSPEWPAIYLGIVSLGATAVPTDAKLREQEVAHVLRDSGCRILFASEKTYAITREIESRLPGLEHVVVVSRRDFEPPTGGKVTYGAYTVETADANPSEAFERAEPRPDDVASIIYTSGTTGRQKGAMLTHANFCSNVRACLEALDVSAQDNFMLVLPLHHAFAFTTNLLLPIAAGAEISFIESLKTVGENMRDVSPTLLIGVPLLIDKMYARTMDGLRRNRLAYLLHTLRIRKPVARRIIKKLGGKLRLMIVGGAPADPRVLRGFASLGVRIIEGYGLTETGPVLTFNPPAEPRPGTVGVALPGVDIRIVDPNSEGIGEIAARGPNIMQGYFNNQEATRAVFNDEWFLTGDLGRLDRDGYLTITGRRKNLIVNREGKNIYPEEIEESVLGSRHIAECMALGYAAPDETGERVGMIVVPDQESFDVLAAERRRPLTDAEIRDLLRDEVKRTTSAVAPFKRPRRVQVRMEEFEKTSTGKIKRYLYAISATEID